MPATPADLFSLLDRLGITHKTVTHPALFTVGIADAARDHCGWPHQESIPQG
jgi:Ala-tRNA(Pro) deacylase